MGKDGTIFLFSICKSKHSSQVKFFLFEICIQAVAAGFPVIQICICTPADCLYLFLCSGTTHDSKYLSGKHHSGVTLCTSFIVGFIWNRAIFYFSSMIIIISIKPAFIPILDPFIFPNIFHEPVCFFFQIAAYHFQRKHYFISTEIMGTQISILLQNLLFFLRVFI